MHPTEYKTHLHLQHKTYHRDQKLHKEGFFHQDTCIQILVVHLCCVSVGRSNNVLTTCFISAMSETGRILSWFKILKQPHSSQAQINLDDCLGKSSKSITGTEFSLSILFFWLLPLFLFFELGVCSYISNEKTPFFRKSHELRQMQM